MAMESFNLRALLLAAMLAILLPDFTWHYRTNATTSIQARPNVLFIITDDQDLHMNSLSAMPKLNKLLGDGGTTYERHFCTVSLCCPSRVNLLTGRAAHNTNVTDLSPPYGGYPKFVAEGLYNNWLPVWLQQAGYDTYYVGKLMNSHSIYNYKDPYVSGLNGSNFLLEPYTYQYYNTVFTNGPNELLYDLNTHTTDLTQAKALNFLDEANNSTRPFFMMLAPLAPHVELLGTNNKALPNVSYGPGILHPPVPQPQYANAFPDAIVPRTPNFNPSFPSGASWIRELPQQNQTIVESNDALYRSRLQVLAGVDDMIDNLVSALEEKGILDNTYIVFTTDNGYHIGQHRLQPGKKCSVETDINIPLLIRGPNVPQGVVTNISSSHTDLAPTFFKMMGIPPRAEFDGGAIPITQAEIDARSGKAEHVQVEFWGTQSGSEGAYGTSAPPVNNTYKAMRVFGANYSVFYSVWCTGDHEIYDMLSDPYQLTNIYLPPTASNSTPSNLSSLTTQGPAPSFTSPSSAFPTLSIASRPQAPLQNRLDALLLVLKSCAGTTCRAPWNVLHPQGNVSNLVQAMDPGYDQFYEKQAKIKFEYCDLGLIDEAEGVMGGNVFGGGTF